jgi:hypothetical protein
MATTHPPQATLDVQAHQRRTRGILVTAFLVMAGSVAWWLTYSAHAVALLEQRVIAGDFPVLRVQEGQLEVDDHGRVVVGGFLPNPPITVASTRLVPRGKYTAVIVANDGVDAHKKKTELVIGAKDALGAWHPASAAMVLDRMKAPRAGSPL